MRNFQLALLGALALAGCMADANMSSRSYLGPADSGAVSSRDEYTAAKEVTRLLEVRGYQMVDQHVDAPNGELQLKFTKSMRGLVASRDPLVANDVGSVFYAWVTPTSPASSTIALLGKPTLAGVEPCTNDGVALPCQNVSTATSFVDSYLSGHDEAEVAHGVLSELALEGFTTGPLPVAPQVAQADKHAACVAQAKDIYTRADQLNDLDARDALLKTVPNCE
ncbi:MAG TPA: hypothetical protein VMJ10_33565 [Kofleriaceae bacterium]|nr:hypothetical protein [Kofleriaceae bacterium]